jgi:hypothetical protein
VRVTSRLRRFAPALVVAVTAAVVSLSAVPAHAVSNPTRQYQESASNSVNKSVAVDCPAGTKVYGGGGSIATGFNGPGEIVLDEFVPNEDLTRVTAQALERPGLADDDWSVSAWAICGPATLNQQRVEFQTTQNSTSPKTAVASCPGSTKVYGLGAELINAQGNVVLDDLTMSKDLSQVSITAYEIGAWTGSWAVKAYAICANAPGGGMSRIELTSTQDGTSPKTVTAAGCPPGTLLHGMGGEITGGLGGVIFEDLTPNNLLNTVSATGKEVAGSSGANWEITSYGVCAA